MTKLIEYLLLNRHRQTQTRVAEISLKTLADEGSLLPWDQRETFPIVLVEPGPFPEGFLPGRYQMRRTLACSTLGRC